mmetsp:Transcript_16402/g.25588  ORF Transcript_16402/g.25588 Transcript_16402/m.25588 type:complete len:931 (+) Transcript_16402:87-2879(+)|eukprot:CAMPEP_0196820894 /NCGR_PEP_ID=MMETSP1362-20130617/76967_1 /TAXON_ID=163516 /ORGANISM="Leptocylindrus danicus, Strain CCMP1856" /LENGTH=930 /DNA_ID=CAMNT_0042199919 /DNA_START=73 /DNA_END=2865 /DNA_ORIENTATION=+
MMQNHQVAIKKRIIWRSSLGTIRFIAGLMVLQSYFLPCRSSVEEAPAQSACNNNEKGCTKTNVPEWKDKLNKIISVGTSSSVLAGLAGSATIALSAAAAAQVERERREARELSPENNKHESSNDVDSTKMSQSRDHDLEYSKDSQLKDGARNNQKQKNDSSNYRNPFEVEEDVLTREGARLISSSFGFARSSFGFLGDSVRVIGDTAAGLTGSSIKVVGSAVKSSSALLDSIGGAVEGEDQRPIQDRNVVENTRHVAGKSVKLVGNIVRGLGDSIVLAGAATETVASSSAGVAEDAVRVFESLAHSLSTTFSPEKRVLTDFDIFDDNSLPQELSDDSSGYISYGMKSHSPSSHVATDDAGDNRTSWYLANLQNAVKKFITYIMADTEGVPSAAPQLLGVIVILYLLTFVVLNSDHSNHPKHPTKDTSQDKDGELRRSFQNNSTPSQFIQCTATVTTSMPSVLERPANGSSVSVLTEKDGKNTARAITLVKACINAALSKRSLLFLVYSLAWIYLCHISKTRSDSIMRNAEARGYRDAITSIGKTSPSMIESAAWLNLLLNQIWRVPYHSSDETLLTSYPPFVSRAIKENLVGELYGGLEPYISTQIGNVLVDALKTNDERPSEVAYLNLNTFTLGSNPPLIRGITLRGSEEDSRVLNLGIDMDALLGDLAVTLVIKLSSLEHARLPSTALLISAVDMRLLLDISLSARPTFPFISSLSISIAEMPKLKVKITPSSESSGLKGVDLGSLPVISTWIQDAIDQQLLQYVSPRFISLDIPGLLGSDEPPPTCERVILPPLLEKPTNTAVLPRTGMKLPKINGLKSPKMVASNLGFDAHPLALAAEAYFAENGVDHDKKQEEDMDAPSTSLNEGNSDALPTEIINKVEVLDEPKSVLKKKGNKVKNVFSSIASALAPVAVGVAASAAFSKLQEK